MIRKLLIGLFLLSSITSAYAGIETDTLTSTTLKNSGNVGIGTTNPIQKLDITGNIAVSGTVDGIDISTLPTFNVSAPTLDQVLRYNGSEFVNGNPVVSSASAGISFFMDDTTLIPTGSNNVNQVNVLLKYPNTAVSEQVDAISVTAATSPVLAEAYLYNTALGRTTIDSGVWNFITYASVSSTAAGRVSSIKRNIYLVKVGSGTLTITGSGTSRTATASSGTPFVAGDANADRTLSGYIQTPQGLYQVSAFSSGTVVTITTPTTYSNESTVAYSVWKYQFGIDTPTITSLTTNYTAYDVTSARATISCLATDKLAEIVFAISNNTTTVNFTHNGTARYSNFQTPLITLHGNLAGLQGGTGSVPIEEYYHLTSAQHTVATQAATSGVNGYLTSTNWNTFNGKEDNLETNAGNVGIGTTDVSSAKLSINGDIRIGSSTTAGYVLTASNTGVGTWQAASSGVTGTGVQNTVAYWDDTGSIASFTYLQRESSSGYVGVNGTNPNSMFSVAGNSVFGSTYVGDERTPPSNGMLVEGNVGIGTTDATKATLSTSSIRVGTSTTSGYVLTADSDGVGSWAAAGSSSSYRDSFTNSDLSAGVLTVNHALGQKYVQVTIYDNNDDIISAEVTATDTNNASVDLSAYGTITGTWNVVVTK